MTPASLRAVVPRIHRSHSPKPGALKTSDPVHDIWDLALLSGIPLVSLPITQAF